MRTILTLVLAVVTSVAAGSIVPDAAAQSPATCSDVRVNASKAWTAGVAATSLRSRLAVRKKTVATSSRRGVVLKASGHPQKSQCALWDVTVRSRNLLLKSGLWLENRASRQHVDIVSVATNTDGTTSVHLQAKTFNGRDGVQMEAERDQTLSITGTVTSCKHPGQIISIHEALTARVGARLNKKYGKKGSARLRLRVYDVNEPQPSDDASEDDGDGSGGDEGADGGNDGSGSDAGSGGGDDAGSGFDDSADTADGSTDSAGDGSDSADVGSDDSTSDAAGGSEGGEGGGEGSGSGDGSGSDGTADGSGDGTADGASDGGSNDDCGPTGSSEPLWLDADFDFASLGEVVVPDIVPIIEGRAQAGERAVLEIGNHECGVGLFSGVVRCTYSASLDGSRYVFSACDSGAAPGTHVSGNAVSLRVNPDSPGCPGMRVTASVGLMTCGTGTVINPMP